MSRLYQDGETVILDVEKALSIKIDRRCTTTYWIDCIITNLRDYTATIENQYPLRSIGESYHFIDRIWYEINESGCIIPQCFLLPYNPPLSFYSKSSYLKFDRLATQFSDIFNNRLD